MHNRKKERSELKRLLASGASAQMFAPRRIGKTWLMRELAKDLERDGWRVIFVDVEGMRTEDEFLRALCRKIEENGDAGGRLKKHFAQRLSQLMTDGWQGNPLQAIGKIDFATFTETLIASLHEDNDRTVIMIDEIALFVAERIDRDKDGAKSFLYQLRRLRQDFPKVRWLFTGSIGLDVVARRGSLLGALVDLKPFVLEAFDDAAARSYIDWLNTTGQVPSPFRLDDENFAILKRELGWLAPFYLQSIADRIRVTGAKESGRPLASPEDIERAFEEMLRPEFRMLFAPFEEHIEKNFPRPESRRLAAILDACCERPEGETPTTLLAGLGASEPEAEALGLNNSLTALANAGILELIGARWRFRSGLLRRYWLRYHKL